MTDYRVTHTLTASNGEHVARIEEWQGVDGPYLAFRYRGADWNRDERLEWAMRGMLARHVEYLLCARNKRDKEWNARAIREIAWALASWATQTNWVDVANG